MYYNGGEWQLGLINMNCELVDPEGLLNELKILKSINVDGVMIDCWWGIVEGHAPQVYNWSGYKRLFQIVRDLKLKLQVSSIYSMLLLTSYACSSFLNHYICALGI